jgi:hypothetical protein
MENLKQARELLAKVRLKRGDNPSSEKENQLVLLIEELTGFCQQIEAQFLVVQKSMADTNRLTLEHNIQLLIKKLEGWHGFLQINLIEKIDFLRQWTLAMGVPATNRDPNVIHFLAALPKQIACYQAWEQALLLPRRVSAIMEIGSKYGLNALVLGRMARIGAVEKDAGMISLSKRLESAGVTSLAQPPIGFTQCDFQPSTLSNIPTDSFDAIWLHRQVWNHWISQDGPLLVAALGDLANKFHFLFFTSTETLPPRHDLLESRYSFSVIGEYEEGSQTLYFILAQRKCLSVAGHFFNCSDMRIHDPTWQGTEHLHLNGALLPWNRTTLPLQTRRLIIGDCQVVRTFLKRTTNLNALNTHLRELQAWRSLGGVIPELPQLLGHSEDTVGYHLLLHFNQHQSRLPHFPLSPEDRFKLLRSAIRLIYGLRLRNLHLNFLRIGNFALTEEGAVFLSAEFISHEEIEDPLDALLWFLRDLKSDMLYWHDYPIESFRVENLQSISEEYQELAILALRSKDIDQFINDPLIEKHFLQT